MTTSKSQEQFIHLYNRAGFGLSPKELTQKSNKSIQQEVEKLIQKAKRNPTLLDNDLALFDKKQSMQSMMSNKENAQIHRKIARRKAETINVNWVNSMVTSDNPLLERMSLFWHGHFACRMKKPSLVINYMNAIRQNALGNFKDLLLAVSKTPAMIKYLNNQQNRKQKPNENFAREVMELFTIGRGNYTENDIKEAARAFTGWAFFFVSNGK